MKAVIFDIKRFAIHDGPGIRTTVFFKGCSLHCWWCHNPESINPHVEKYFSIEKIGNRTFETHKTIGRYIDIENLMEEILKEKIFMEESDGGVTLSGGEPLLQAGFVLQVLKRCKDYGIHTTIDTAGNVPVEYLQHIITFTDLFLYDIKFISNDLHKKYTGVDNQRILRNFEYLMKNNKKVIVRIPLIPKINLFMNEMKKINKYLLQFKGENFSEIQLMPYHHTGKAKYIRFDKENKMKGISEPGTGDILAVKKYFETNGFKVTIQ